MAKAAYLSAGEAAAELGISRATLYAYVSRGLVRSEAAPGQARQRLYNVEDIERLKQRQDLRQNPVKTAEQALNWGIPVLESGLTLISNGRLYYRGQDTLRLARESSLEDVAALLWSTPEAEAKPEWAALAPPTPAQPPDWVHGMIPAFQTALLQAEAQDPAAFDLRPSSVAHKGFRLLQMLAQIAGRTNGGTNPPAGKSVAETLQVSWLPEHPQTRRLLEAALVLCADHELNVSAFTVRCVASAGSSPYAAVLGGLAALQGVKHGGASRRVEALFQEVGKSDRVQAVLSERLRRGEDIPGFGHPLYPAGDPRARLLLELLEHEIVGREGDLAQAIAQTARDLLGELPTIDYALVVLRRSLALPPDTAIMLFAIGRTVGWVAHAIEQYRMDALIRPRARYAGPQPV